MPDLYKVYTVVLSVLINIEIVFSQDVSICNFTTAKVPPPPPRMVPSYSTTIEWKNVDTNSTMIVNEYFDSIQNIGSQDIYTEQQYTKIVYDNKENQMLQYTKADGCTVTDLGSFTFYKDKVWITAFNEFYGIVTKSVPVFIETTTIRNITVNHWQACLYILESAITIKVDFFFSKNWNMEYSSSQDFIPVRFEVKGSMLKSTKDGGKMLFHVIGDFVNFDPQPNLQELQTHMQLPAGVFCDGKKSSNPLNPLPEEFSVTYEIVDNTKNSITYEHIWYNNIKKVVRRDFKKSSNSDPDATMEIFDFNLGIHYIMDPDAGSCSQAELLSLRNRYVKPNGNDTIRMISAAEFFNVKNTQIQYVGYRKTRGVLCDVWVGRYLDPGTNTNSTIEWYFNKKYSEAVGGTIAYSSLTRIDIWETSATQPVIRNVLQIDNEPPTQDMFSVGLCYKTQRIRILVHFRVMNGSVSDVTDRYLKDTLHIKLTNLAFLPPLRMTDVILSQIGDGDLYFDGSLLEKAPFVNSHIVPKPTGLHELNTAYDFLRGSLTSESEQMITISNTSSPPLILKALAIQKLDYVAEFSKPPSTPTTPFRSPPIPDPTPSPTPIQPETPTTYHTPDYPSPGHKTQPPCSCQNVTCKPCQACSQSTVKCPTTAVSQPTSTTCTCPPPVTCPSSTAAKCQNVTCKPCQACSQSTVKCPTTAVSTTCSCPKVTCPSSSETKCPSAPPCKNTCAPSTVCPPKSCRKETCRPCQACSPTTVKCPTIQPGTSTKANSPKNALKQTGISNGAAAGVGISMVVIGVILGVILLRVMQKIMKKRDPERNNFFSTYLSDDGNY